MAFHCPWHQETILRIGFIGLAFLKNALKDASNPWGSLHLSPPFIWIMSGNRSTLRACNEGVPARWSCGFVV